jgi:lipoprotein signal peptidase
MNLRAMLYPAKHIFTKNHEPVTYTVFNVFDAFDLISKAILLILNFYKKEGIG